MPPVARLTAIALASCVVAFCLPATAGYADDTGSDQTIIVTMDSAKGDTTQAAQDAVEATGATVTDSRAVSDRSVAVTVSGATQAKAKAIGEAVSDESGVTAAQPSRRVRAAATAPNDPDYAQQWNLTGTYGVDAADAWSTSTGAGVVVGVVDTGITAHPDLSASTTQVEGGNVVAGYDFISDATGAGDGNGRDSDPTDMGDYYDAEDSSWHGTHVSGIIAAIKDNDIGVVGVAPSASIEPLRVLGRNYGDEDDIIAAISWGAGLSAEGMTANPHPVSVLNLSLGGGGYSPNPSDYECGTGLQTAIDAAVAKGVAIVVAAGNSDPSGDALKYSFPANCNNVIRVTATDSSGKLAYYSNYGTTDMPATIAAPGDDILSTINDGTTTPADASYGTMSGTSMATPHVSAVVALLRAAKPSLSVSQIVSVLTSTARPTSDGCSAIRCGAGIVDAAAAVAAVDDSSKLETATVSVQTPAISGTAKVGSTLWASRAGHTPSTGELSWEWLRNGTATGVTASTYTAGAADKDAVLTVKATVRSFDTTASATSAGVTIAGLTFTSVPRPKVSGTFRVGHKLKVSSGTIRPAASRKSYQWLRNGTAIADATGTSHRLVKADRGKKISVRVTVSKWGYVSRSATSTAHKVK